MKTSPPYVLAFDCGTTGCKAILIDTDGFICSEATKDYPTITLEGGFLEQDPAEWWSAVRLVTRRILKASGAKADDLLGMGFCGTMCTTLPIDRKGAPLRRAILYADTRSFAECERLKRLISPEELYRITGNPASPVPSLTKWMWIREKEPRVFDQTFKFVQPKDLLVLKSTGEISTDYVDASTTMAFDLRERRWRDEILDLAGIASDLLPQPHSSTDIAGELTTRSADELGLKKGIPVIVGTGDTGALLTGVGAVENESSTVYLGSAAQIDVTIEKPVLDPGMRIPVRCHTIPESWFTSATTSTSGTALRWFVEQFLRTETRSERKAGVSYKALDEQADVVPPGSRGLLFLPYLLGGRAPIWDPKASGAFIGIHLSSTKIDFYRSILEGVAFSLKDLLEVYTEMGIKLSEARFSGGGAKSSLWKRIVSDVLGLKCLDMSNPLEASALGVAMCVNVALGRQRSFKDAAGKFRGIEGICVPNEETRIRYETLFRLYRLCYPALSSVMHSLANLTEQS